MTRTTNYFFFGALRAMLLSVGLAALVLMTIAASVGVQEAQAKKDASAVAPKGNKPGVGASGVNSIAAFGSNKYGQLGNGKTTDSNKPVAVSDLAESEVKDVAAGSLHSLALKRDGTVWAWGRGDTGVLGNGTYTSSNTPVQVKDPNDATGYLTGVVAIDAGDRHSVALKDDQTVWTWGTDMYGSLGLGSDSARAYNLPQQVVDLDGVTSIAAGKFHTLALKEDGSVYAWGDNSDGALGDNSFEESDAPVNVRGNNGRILSEVNSIAAGDGMSLAVKNDGTVLSWGWLNQDPESGELIKLPFAFPVYNADKTPLSGVRQISAGFNHVLAVNNDGTVTSWGFNFEGALGNGTTSQNYTPPAKVPNLSGIKAVAAGSRYSLARTTSGRVYAWGSNKAGQLGDGTNTSRLRPVQVPNLTGVFSISASKHNNDDLHSLAQ